MSLRDHARRELELAGLFDANSDYGGAIGTAVMEIVEKFSEQGHSGGSAWVMLGVLERLLRWQPLTPLTSNPEEWTEVEAGKMWQSRRCPSVFSADGGKTGYDIDGKRDNPKDAVPVAELRL